VSKRRKGSDFFGWDNFSPKKSSFRFDKINGANRERSLDRPMPWKYKFRPEQNLKDFSILFDYNYASMWTRWRRGYELYMYANQALEGINYTFRYAINGQAGSGGVELPGICYMYPSSDQDMGMRMTVIRPRDSFNFLDFGYSVAEVFNYDTDNKIIGVRLSSNFGAPISFFTGEVLSDRFNADGTEKTVYNNYTVVAVGTKTGGPAVPSPAPFQDTLFLSVTENTSWTTLENGFVAPAQSNPTVGDFFTTTMRFGCNCPDYLGREDFNLYKYAQKRTYPYTGVEDLKPGVYDAGTSTFDGSRPTNTRDLPGFARDFGFIYTKNLFGQGKAPEGQDNAASSYSDPNLLYFQPRMCKHIYAAFWDMQNRFSNYTYLDEMLAQPNDEPMDDRYREYFEMNLAKSTNFSRQVEQLNWWEKYSPVKQDVPTHMLYSDMNPTVVKVLNFDTLASGGVSPLVSSGFSMFDIDTFNPLQPVPPGARPIYDGGTYLNGAVVSGASPTFIYDGGSYLNGSGLPPLFRPSINGGTY
jgi:hypothetical protein